MKTVKQLLRQPVKTLLGVLLMTLATAILCICLGQAVAARETLNKLEASFTTIGLLHQNTTSNNTLEAAWPGYTSTDDLAWINAVAQEHPEIVKGIHTSGVLSAYVPELIPLHFTEGLSYSTKFVSIGHDYFNTGPKGMPYTCAALTFTLEEIGEPEPRDKIYYPNQKLDFDDFGGDVEKYFAYLDTIKETVNRGYTLKLAGTVTGVVDLNEGFRDPTGMIMRITVTMATQEELEALMMDLEIGSEYLAFGVDYTDMDWNYRSMLASDPKDPLEIDYFDPAKINILEGEEKERWKDSSGYSPYAIYNGRIYLTQENYEKINSVSLSLGLVSTPHRLNYDEDGMLIGIEMLDEWIGSTFSGEEVQIPLDEYLETYRIPTLAKLTTTVEEFLASEEGAVWRETLDWAAINDQAFAVVGVDQLGYLPEFGKGSSRIVEGRDFTEEELTTGARVCLIHESLAAANGLKVGDTITLNMYEMDQCLPYFQRGYYVANIPAYYYYPTELFVDNAEYTIVGFWRGQQLWIYNLDEPTAFLPNTLIVPQSSVQAEMTVIPYEAFVTLVLQNGQITAFNQLMADMGYENSFVFFDQGYSDIAPTFHSYDEMEERVLIIGAAVYGVLLLMFLLLFPASRRKSVRTMETLGVPFGGRFAGVVGYSAALLIPASLLGGLLGAASWRSVVNTLVESAESAITMELSLPALAGIALLQCVVALLLSMLIALSTARSAGMAKKR